MTDQIDYRNRFMHHDLADFAQEFLIRNPDYRYQVSAIDGASTDTESASLARRWGLEFRCAAGPECEALPGNLAQGRGPFCRAGFMCPDASFSAQAIPL